VASHIRVAAKPPAATDSLGSTRVPRARIGDESLRAAKNGLVKARKRFSQADIRLVARVM
jgi:hypothetical protein